MPNSITGSCMVVIADPQIAKEAFVTNTDVAGRPFGVHRATSQKIFNPFFPKAGMLVMYVHLYPIRFLSVIGQKLAVLA